MSLSGRMRGLISGGVLLGAGAVLIQTSILGPLADAQGGRPVSYSEKALFLIPMAVGIGLFMWVAAAMFPKWIERQAAQPRISFSQRSGAYKASVIGAVIVIFAAGGALRFWFVDRLAALGYH
jgi:hypothetical protein